MFREWVGREFYRIYLGFSVDEEIKCNKRREDWILGWEFFVFVLGVFEGRVDTVVNNYLEVSVVIMWELEKVYRYIVDYGFKNIVILVDMFKWNNRN